MTSMTELTPPTTGGEVAGQRAPWGGREVFLGLLVFLAAILLGPLPFVAPFYAIAGEKARSTLLAGIIVSTGVYVAIVGIAAYYTFGRYGGGWGRLGFRRPSWRTLGWAAAGLAAAFVVATIYGGAIEIFNIDWLKQECDDQIPVEIRNDPLLLGLTSALAVLFAPVAEEVFYRGFILPGLARTWGLAAGIAASGALFGASHLLGNPTLWPTLLLFTAIGIIFAFAYHRSGNLLATVAAHAGFNLVGVIAIAATTCRPE
ncbi:MAG: type II CAAX endopeptidase family protein [Dehalococcoidia bacterium]